DVLIRAFAAARGTANLSHVLALVGGRGWMYASLFELVRELGLQEHVRFAGYVDPAHLPLWYNAADLFAYPSAYEGFGLPVLEAMACGIPTVTSSSGALQELAGDACLTVEPGSVESLQLAIVKVLEDPDLVERLRTASLARAAGFSWMKAAAATAGVYERVARS
ncbi:MAG: glycosyltransferase family 4 protein, partial [Chloroflexota bacterium]